MYDLSPPCLHRIKMNIFWNNNCLMRASDTFGIKYCKFEFKYVDDERNFSIIKYP